MKTQAAKLVPTPVPRETDRQKLVQIQRVIDEAKKFPNPSRIVGVIDEVLNR